MNKINEQEEIKLKSLFSNNAEAMNAYNILKYTTNSVFLTGKAGSGKSTFLKQIQAVFPYPTPIIAPTALSACNVNGTTIHSYFHLPPEFILPRDKKLQDYYPTDQLRSLFSYIDLIIIEEISMVSAATLDCIDFRLKQICNSKLPFGGIQMLFVGDPFQLPPIVKEENKEELYSNYANEHFFESEAFKKLNPIIIELQPSYRQNDELFISSLDNIRNNKNIEETIALFNDKCFYNKNMVRWSTYKNIITLCYRNEFVKSINMNAISLLPGKLFEYRAIVEGEFDWNGVGAEKVLYFKKGAFIMMTKNHPERLYVNGTLGFIDEVYKEKLVIRGLDGELFDVFDEKWTTIQRRKVKSEKFLKWEEIEKGSMKQFPIKLASAITIHKSQGLTFDNVLFNNNVKPFSAGQSYVALSRSRSLEGLKLSRKLTKRDIRIDKNVLRFYKTIKREKRVTELLNQINREIDDENSKVDN